MRRFPPSDLPFWERPDVVEMFAGREPDLRMTALLRDAPRSVRVLDIGCAGGRNSVWLARAGFDLYAVDTSKAMLARTRDRVAEVLGEAEAERRIIESPMDDLGHFADASFGVVLAFGVYQGAASETEWHRAVAETARVLEPGGHLLVAHFGPDSDPSGEGIRLVAGERHIYTNFFDERAILLLDTDELDVWMRRHGLAPVADTEVVRVTTEAGYRTTVNGHYRKGSAPMT